MPSDEETPDHIDERKIVTGVVDNAVNRIIKSAEDSVRRRIGKYRNKIGVGFETYLNRRKVFCENVKSSILSADSVKIGNIYVDSVIVAPREVFSEQQYFDRLLTRRDPTSFRDHPASVVTGPAGIGKSLFLKSIFLRAINEQSEYIPVFLELRDLNRIKLTNLVDALTNELNRYGSGPTHDQVIDWSREWTVSATL